MISNCFYMLKLFFSFLLILSSFFSHAQLLDSLTSYLKHKPRITFRFDSKTSFISSSSVSIWGANLGLDFHKKLKTGLGYYFLFSDYEKNTIVSRENKSDTLVNTRLRFDYGGIFFEYIFYSNEKWEMSFPLHFGFGISRYKYNIDEFTYQKDKRFMALYEANISAQYKIVYWFGVGAGIGYRLMLINNNAMDDNFNAPIYAVKVNIFFGDLYRKYFPKKAGENITTQVID